MAVTSVGQPVAAIKAAAASGSFTSFTTVAGHSYVVCVAVATNQSGVVASTVSWSAGGSGTWSKLASFNINQFEPTNEIWYCQASSSVASSTIHVAGNTFATAVYATVDEISGDATTQNGATATSSASSGAISITPNSTGSLIFTSALDINEGFTATANGSSTLLDSWNNSGAENYSCVSSSTTTASTPVSVGVTNTVTANSQLAVEIVPSAGGGSISGTVAVTQANNTASASGSLNESGTLARTQANNTASAAGTVINPVTGTAAVAQANNVANATGSVSITGSAAIAQPNNVANASGLFAVPITGTVAVAQDNNRVSATGLIGGIGITITVLGTPPFYGRYSGFYTLAAAQYAFGPNANPSGLNLTPGTYDVFLVTTQPASGPTKIGTVVILS